MNNQELAETLGVSSERIERLLGRVVMRSSWPEPQLFRLDKAVAGAGEGTVVFDNGEVVCGYPKIKRAMMLEPALKRFFPGTVVAEEKMNGHNVRVFRVDGNVVALTRGGFICPYSTEVAREQVPVEIFNDRPNLVLCGEMVGPNNPYVTKNVYPVESMDFYLFDVSSKGSREMKGLRATHELARKYGIKDVPLLGEFDSDEAYWGITKIIKRLGNEGREGVVLKDPNNVVRPIKYTSSESNCADLKYAFRYYNDYGRDFIFSRVVREGFQSAEWNESEKEFKARCLRLGMSLVGPMKETVETKMADDSIVQKVQIKVKDLKVAKDFEIHFRRLGVRSIFHEPEHCGDGFLVRISRLAMSTNDKTKSVIDGNTW